MSCRVAFVVALMLGACAGRAPDPVVAGDGAVERSAALRMAGDWMGAGRVVDAALAAAPARAGRARLLIERATIEHERGAFQRRDRLDAAAAALDEAEPLVAGGEAALRAAFAEERGWVTYFRAFEHGRFDEAMPHFETARALREQLGDRAGLARSWFQVGLVHQQHGRIDEAEAAFNRGMALARDLPVERSYLERHLGAVMIDRGAPDKAIPHFERSLALREQAGLRWGVAFAAVTLAEAVFTTDRPRARALIDQADAIAAELALHVAAAVAAELRARLEHEAGEVAAACAALVAAERSWAAFGQPAAVAAAAARRAELACPA